MAVYVVLLFDLDDAVISADTIDAADRDAARAHALRLQRATLGAEGHEVWLDGRKIVTSLAE